MKTVWIRVLPTRLRTASRASAAHVPMTSAIALDSSAVISEVSRPSSGSVWKAAVTLENV
jgi:hypothetical protein